MALSCFGKKREFIDSSNAWQGSAYPLVFRYKSMEKTGEQEGVKIAPWISTYSELAENYAVVSSKMPAGLVQPILKSKFLWHLWCVINSEQGQSAFVQSKEFEGSSKDPDKSFLAV